MYPVGEILADVLVHFWLLFSVLAVLSASIH